MQSKVDCGLVLQYVRKIQLLAMTADFGVDVKPEIEAIVNDACKYFLNTAGDDACTNIRILKNELTYQANLARKTRHEYQNALNYAIALVGLSEV
ncbi:hypothetical protein [Collimonas sp. PA-H2]|uniref:hypothetical protein n=1 Tax=Collimonas sp. PA-H2 TaxID=1881062 RepID=UPI000BF64A9B|nr:hypothetical protein [Collimonas sp. PA-H2]